MEHVLHFSNAKRNFVCFIYEPGELSGTKAKYLKYYFTKPYTSNQNISNTRDKYPMLKDAFSLSKFHIDFAAN